MKIAKIRFVALVLFLCSLVILLGSTVNYARSALNIRSEKYVMDMEMYDIGITLNENEEAVAWRNYSGNDIWEEDGIALLGHIAEEDFSYGKIYPERLSVTNSGRIDTYVRVIIYRYWLDEEGKKDLSLDPAYIDLHLTDSENWLKDESYSYDSEKNIYHETITLYYALPLKGKDSASDPEERTTELFADTLVVDGDIKKYYTQSTYVDDEGYTVVSNAYTYNGRKFCIDVKADAVQTHNAEKAILSVWGRKVSIDDAGRMELLEEEG